MNNLMWRGKRQNNVIHGAQKKSRFRVQGEQKSEYLNSMELNSGELSAFPYTPKPDYTKGVICTYLYLALKKPWNKSGRQLRTFCSEVPVTEYLTKTICLLFFIYDLFNDYACFSQQKVLVRRCAFIQQVSFIIEAENWAYWSRKCGTSTKVQVCASFELEFIEETLHIKIRRETKNK